MDKNELKEIVLSMKNDNNENCIKEIMEKIDSVPDDRLEKILDETGRDDESIKKYVQERIESKKDKNKTDEHIPINKMISYGVNGKTIHLHLPVDLHDMMNEKGMQTVFDTANIYLLDAMDKVRQMKKEGREEFKDADNIYMISHVLVGPERKFLEELDFETNTYRKKELQDEEFVKNNKEAALAVRIFGNEKNISSARIDLDKLDTEEWQEKKNAKIKELNEKGITLDNKQKNNNEKER